MHVDTLPAAQTELDTRLRITEIFHSLQGETNTVGIPTVFVRLTGCPLRCGYCDTVYAFHGGESRTVGNVLADVARYQTRYVTVTGGEPLAQQGCLILLRQLCDHGYEVSLETSGALDVADVDPRVTKILDIKTPGSGEMERNRYENLRHLTARDQVKFVLVDRIDYDWAKARLTELRLTDRCEVLFSPAHEQLPAAELAEWILADRLPVRFQIQLHKYLWGNVPGK
ncbi:MAG: 7-carboxy-7-deazaguanine synthase QueE [Chromatiales bacterium]